MRAPFLLLLLVGVLHAQVDSLQLPVTTVQAQRPVYHNAIGRITYRADSLGNFAAPGLGLEALLHQLQGAYLQDYGGHSGVKTLSMRGFATNQTTLSIEGVSLENPQLSVVNLANYYLTGMSTVEVSTAAPTLSQNPLAGNVDLGTGTPAWRYRALLGTGSYGLQQAALSGRWQRTRHSLLASYHHTRAEDDYPYHLNETSGTRLHADYANHQGMLRYGYRLSPRTTLTYMAMGLLNRQNIPAPIVKGTPPTATQQLEQGSLFHFARLDYRPDSIAALRPSRARLLLRHQHDEIRVPPAQWYQNRGLLAEGSLRLPLVLSARWALLTDILGQINYQHLRSDHIDIDRQPVPTVHRTQAIAAAGLQADYCRGHWSWHTTLHYRHQYASDYGHLPNLALHTRLTQGDTLKKSLYLHATRGYRLPSFNELYFRNYGNPDLLAEQPSQLDLGLSLQYRRLHGQATIFVNETRNKIVSIPLSPVQWSTLGLGYTTAHGLELSAEWQPLPWLALHYTYTWLMATDRSVTDGALLPYTPRELVRGGLLAQKWRLQLGVQAGYTGWRYSSLQAGSLTYLPPYLLLDAWLRYTHPLKKGHTLQATLATRNLGDVSYEVIRAFPMPGRTWSATLSWCW